MTILDAIEEAFEQCGLMSETGYDVRTGRRSLGMVYKRIANRGFNSWQLVEYTNTLTAGTASYTLVDGSYDLPLLNIKQGTSGAEISLGRPLSMSDYNNIPNKDLLGKPVNYFVHRQQSGTFYYLWPTPNSSDLIVDGYRAQYQGATEEANDTSIQVPGRFEPAFVAELAAEISVKKAPDRYPMLSMRAKELWREAERGDSGNQSLFIIPVVA